MRTRYARQFIGNRSCYNLLLSGDSQDLAGPDFEVVAEVEQKGLRQDGLGNLGRHTLVPTSDTLLLENVTQNLKRILVRRVLSLQTDLGQDVGETG